MITALTYFAAILAFSLIIVWLLLSVFLFSGLVEGQLYTDNVLYGKYPVILQYVFLGIRAIVIALWLIITFPYVRYVNRNNKEIQPKE